MPKMLILGNSDDVAVALNPLEANTSIPELKITALSDIPAGHKIALHAIPAGHPIRKFNQIIGFATNPIAVGEHVHTHNLITGNFERDYSIGTEAHSTELLDPAHAATFQGIVRSDGRVATRNYVGVLTTVNCSATVARRIAAHFTAEVLSAYPNVDGVVAITHGTGCGMAEHGEPADLLRRVFAGYATHPNFASVLLLGLGCETNQIDSLITLTGSSPNLRTSTIQEEGGTAAAIRNGIATVREMLEQANQVSRATVSASNLMVGLQCGGSDAYSGISANPALGAAVDLLVQNGGTAILSETPEIYGAEHLLTRRSASPDVAARLIERIHWWEEYTARHKGSIDNNPQPGNKTGGLTTILEKSLGAISKGGTTNLVEVYRYAEPIHKKGLVFMDSPGFDPVSATGQVASGANLLCFTTGRGSVFGCKPSPSIKLASNTPLYKRMADDMDINCGTIIDGEETVQQAGLRIFNAMLATASGRQTRSEELGFGEEEFQPWLQSATL
ncbi:MAG TPA: altronate dehydratase family protein [Edaphobacter sp.]|uniref:UxaA family hydrolase n=1 Tax=Edaphobacter sp. TaxID=1934404 RepID=UPI002C9E0541|nr:altronate dehydratase family protein [Edaphobacter sp.]HUZ94632.1 altronate dehydratase family protein [Edaphobacter sp.]